jgi:Phosphotransferase enzyme family
MPVIGARLRAAAEAGEVAGLDGSYAAGARFQAGLPGRRIVRSDALAGLAELWDQPAELVEWDCREHPAGIALWLERRHADGTAQRQRHYLHVDEGRIAAHWIYAAPPRSNAPVMDRPPDDVFALVGDVAERTPLVSRGWSGARLERATMTDGRRLIAKRVDPSAEWISRWTDDPGREGILARDHVLAGLDGIDPAVLAAAPDGDAWWIVMRDVTNELIDDTSPLERDDHRRIMAALAGMWTAFEGTTIDCLATTRSRLGLAGPPVAERERDGHDLLPNQFEAAWEAFLEAVEPDVADAVVSLVTEPGRLADALDARGTTLIHGDVRDEQVGFARDGRVVLLDWGLATRGNPAVELAWYLMHCAWRIRATREELVEDFATLRDDRVALDLGLLSGLVMYGWILGHSAVVHPDPAERAWAHEELGWWVPRARAGLEHL